MEATGKVTTGGEQAPLVLIISRDITERKQ
ncbi:MAG: hypothetical protein KAX19_13280, partial [Candidatus Brocadiae bacterium]|nr:hypothetical protein [Candidatus Brocadiia bacterium]